MIALNRKKKLSMFAIAGGIVLILLGVAWFRMYRDAFGKIQTDLSKRSQEFIDAERAKSQSSWKEIHLGTPVPQAGDVGTRFSTPCFTIALPFTIRDQHIDNKDGSCTFAVRVLFPPARLVVWARPLRITLSEDTAVTLRRSKRDVYTESQLSTSTVPDVVQFRSSDELILFFTKGTMEYSFAFTNVVSEKLKASDLQAMLDGFTPFTQPTLAPKPLKP